MFVTESTKHKETICRPHVYEVIDSRLYIVNRPKSISALLIYNIKKRLSRDSPKENYKSILTRYIGSVSHTNNH